MFDRFRLRLEDRRHRREDQKYAKWRLKQRQRNERLRLGHYHDGFNARMAGRPCDPPGCPPIRDYDPDEEGYYGMRYQAWAEGWEAADKEAG